MGGKRKYIINEPTVDYEEIGIEATQFIQLKSDTTLFYNVFHNRFMLFNMADSFTIKKAREIKKELNQETILVTRKKIQEQIGKKRKHN